MGVDVIFTNLNISFENYLSNNQHFHKSALSQYTQWDFIDLVKKHDIPFYEKTKGQLFCKNKSKDILNMLLRECEDNNVHIALNTAIDHVSRTDNKFIVCTDLKRYQAHSLVVATGGLSIPTLGSSPLGYNLARQFGLTVEPTRAGLVPFTLNDVQKETFKGLSGVSSFCHVRCNSTVFQDNILFTHRGLSGRVYYRYHHTGKKKIS